MNSITYQHVFVRLGGVVRNFGVSKWYQTLQKLFLNTKGVAKKINNKFIHDVVTCLLPTPMRKTPMRASKLPVEMKSSHMREYLPDHFLP